MTKTTPYHTHKQEQNPLNAILPPHQGCCTPLSLFNTSSIRKAKMPEIQVKCSCGETNCPEWAVIEVQGVVEPQGEFVNRLPNLEIGRLCRPSEQETYTFTIGYHELTGSRVKLKKPLLVLKKVKQHSDMDSDANAEPSPRVELDVIGIIRQKILFKTRPKALITSSKKV